MIGVRCNMPETTWPTNKISDQNAATKAAEEIFADYRKETSALRRQIKAAGIYHPSDMRYTQDFYRFRRIDPYYMVEGGFEYLFFTKPDLNILDSAGELTHYHYQDTDIYGDAQIDTAGGAAGVPYFIFLKRDNYDKTILNDLCMEYKDKACPFVRLLSNRKCSNMDIPDIIANEIETSQNMYGTRIFYPTSSMKSDEDAEFNIEFEDTQFLEVYHFFKAYDMYRQLKWLGLVEPKPQYRLNKILHDHISIYKFIVDTDGETLLYWAKATGVYPKTISRSSFSELQEKGGLKITVGFKLSGWFEDMEPNILSDFNQLSMRQLNSYSMSTLRSKQYPIWDSEIGAVSGESVDYFYIDSYVPTQDDINRHNYRRYQLKAGKLR